MADDGNTYLTYRPLSNLPTPPPSYYREAKSPSTLASGSLEDGEPLMAKFRGMSRSRPAIHLVNLIPSSASLATASVLTVQAVLSRADLPIETVALAVCILDSLDKRFARAWRLSCPLLPGSLAASSTSKRHTIPATPILYQHQQHQMLHIDSVPPELIILAALVIAVKFIEDPQRPTQYYCNDWGHGTWSHDQLNATERCIMESLNYRIMPLCDEDCLSDAMVDMQLAGKQLDWGASHPSPPQSVASSSSGDSEGDSMISRRRSETMAPSTAALGHGPSMTPSEPPRATSSEGVSPQGETTGTCYFSDDEFLP
ncbi:Cyclin-like protein [Metarhizium album ARSEF 1941]|uniref:Cyclin-like protein n=1 Tax=Metarhizium album (strain ARSEF 1941) TaxID=1081103 RepID=A0A0B2WQD5_METAS|nr:Cyclin-like protein [Metarhizium album ARSEF 1941]KHN95707.1 Cyclin-like protein [Metarhizium album ARSEF 1941]